MTRKVDATMSQHDSTQDFVTLDDIFEEMGIEVRNFVDKADVAKEVYPFCITAISFEDVKESKFDIPQQWKLDVLVSLKDAENTQVPFWMTFLPNETRNEILESLKKGLEKLPEGKRIIHNCLLQAIPLSQTEDGKTRSFYQINKMDKTGKRVECSCKK